VCCACVCVRCCAAVYSSRRTWLLGSPCPHLFGKRRRSHLHYQVAASMLLGPKTPKRDRGSLGCLAAPPTVACALHHVFDDCRFRARVAACAMGATRPSQIGCDRPPAVPTISAPRGNPRRFSRNVNHKCCDPNTGCWSPRASLLGLHGEGGRLPACLRHQRPAGHLPTALDTGAPSDFLSG
jgi:hypothetical protein